MTSTEKPNIINKKFISFIDLKMSIGIFTTVFGLFNAIIGNWMLILPVAALSSGYATWTSTCLILCLVSGYTSTLMVQHLGKSKNIKYLILNHFGNVKGYTIFYNIVVMISLSSSTLVYFKFLINQVEGLFGHGQFIPEYCLVGSIIWVIFLR